MQFIGEPYVPEYVEVNKLEKPQKTFFFERRNGTIFMAQEREAAQSRKKFRLIGTSSGEEYYKVMKEAIESIPTDEKGKRKIKYTDMPAIVKRAFEAELAVARGHIEQPVERNLLYADKGITEKDMRGFM